MLFANSMNVLDSSNLHLLESGVDPVLLESLICVERREVGGSLIDLTPEPTDFCDGGEEEEFDDSNVSKASCNQMLLPVSPSSCFEMNSSSAILVAEQENFPVERELQAAIPAIAMIAGAFGALTAGADGGLEMIGFVAITSLVVYELIWASNRRILWADLVQVTDREKLVCFLKSRNIVMTN